MRPTRFAGEDFTWYTPNISNLWGPTGAAYPVSIVAGSHGVVTPAGTILVGVGGSTNVQAEAEQPGYRLAAIVTNGTVAWTNATGDNAVIATNISVGPVTQGETVAVYFAAKTYAAPTLWGEWTPGGVRVWFGTEAGGGYALEASGTLATNGWSELETLTGTGTLTNLLDETASGWPARFYRVRVSPPPP